MVTSDSSCGTIALMVLGQFSDICGLQISENWPRTIRATRPQISENWPRTIRAKGPQISENWPRTIRATVPQLMRQVVAQYRFI